MYLAAVPQSLLSDFETFHHERWSTATKAVPFPLSRRRCQSTKITTMLPKAKFRAKRGALLSQLVFAMSSQKSLANKAIREQL